ncbi:MAG: efflux transporter periplasmic adaptor subunit, partial [Planctomycetes bacterium]|nr:efflux transporter periplasmic adaptor subunit [Planctomycetota bacterium]
MNTNRDNPSKTASEGGKKRLWITLGAFALVFVLALIMVLAGTASSSDNNMDGKIFTVKRGPLTISITERGTIKNRTNVIVKNKVEGRHAIISLVDEGVIVKKGDLLMELDSSDLIERKETQEITVTNSEASYISARESLAVTKNQAQSNIDRAELDVEFSKLDLKKYVEGEYPQQLQRAEADITIAEGEKLRAEERFKWSQKLAAEKYLTRTELKADELAAKRRTLELEEAQRNLRVLKEFTHVRRLAELRSNVQQAAMALERAKRKAAADILGAEANLKAKQSQFLRQKSYLNKIIEQINYCKIYSPVDARVVYATSA